MSTSALPRTVVPAAAPRLTRLVTGLTASGRLHVGNYVGAVRPLLELAASGSTQPVVFVADLHAMTVEHDPGVLRERTRELAATLLACGLGDDATLFLQSAVPAHAELAYLLECTAAYGEMTRMIQFKEKAGRERSSARLSLLTYPALMAADILLYQADVVPVGDDQRQHLELARDIAQRFNRRFGSTLVVPDAAIPSVGAASSAAAAAPVARRRSSSAGSAVSSAYRERTGRRVSTSASVTAALSAPAPRSPASAAAGDRPVRAPSSSARLATPGRRSGSYDSAGSRSVTAERTVAAMRTGSSSRCTTPVPPSDLPILAVGTRRFRTRAAASGTAADGTVKTSP